jgi:hypothetical protein
MSSEDQQPATDRGPAGPRTGTPDAETPEAVAVALLARDRAAMADPFSLYAILREQAPVFDAAGLCWSSR